MVDRETQIKQEGDFDHYATSKSVSQTMLNTATLQAQILILVNTLSQDALSGQQVALVVMIALSMTLELVIFVLLVCLAKTKVVSGKIGRFSTTGTNSLVTALTGLLLMITSAISVLFIPNSVSTTRNVTL